jgi:hypothetical protein
MLHAVPSRWITAISLVPPPATAAAARLPHSPLLNPASAALYFCRYNEVTGETGWT